VFASLFVAEVTKPETLVTAVAEVVEFQVPTVIIADLNGTAAPIAVFI
jgi:hypothetical protein